MPDIPKALIIREFAQKSRFLPEKPLIDAQALFLYIFKEINV